MIDYPVACKRSCSVVNVNVRFFRDKIPSGHYPVSMSPLSPGEQDICGNILLLTIMNALYSIDVVSSMLLCCWLVAVHVCAFVFNSVLFVVNCWFDLLVKTRCPCLLLSVDVSDCLPLVFRRRTLL